MTESIEWVTVETSPLDAFRSSLSGGYVYEPEWADLPPDFAAALHQVVDNFDSASCQANGCGFGRVGGFPAPVGYVLHEPDYGNPSQSWSWLTLVKRTDGAIVGVCEECAPTSIYDTKATLVPPKVTM